MADLDFDLDSPQPKDFYWDNFVGLCAEVRRLRAIEDAARAFVQYGNEAVVADHQRLVDALEAGA
ncbi:MAG TPA: hypothetical protein PK912_06145 [Microthrixaceae bacterium]|nr:hypothetical protein [Microthrixaceae bacterium]